MEETKTENTKIYKKLYEIMKAVGFIKKDKTNKFHKYNYASEEIIKKTLHEQLAKNKVLFKLDIIERVREGSLTTIKVKYSFTDVESGECVSGLFIADGDDNQDKGIYKAITGAIKYIMTSTFLIPTGDDVENDRQPVAKQEAKKPVKPKPKNFGGDVKVPLVCADCDANVTVPVRDYSIEHYGRVLCMPCQKKEKKKREEQEEPDYNFGYD